MKRYTRLLTGIVLLYCAITAAVVIFQRSLIYQNTQLSSSAPDPAVASLVSLTTEDKLTLQAWWVNPAPNARPIALVYCHGNGGTLPRLAHVAKMFQSYGLHALLFDYRSYGASDRGALSEDALARDARAAYDWVRSQPGITDSNIVVWGHSLGAAVAARLATERKPAGLIIEGAFSSIFDMAEVRYPWLLLSEQLLLDRYPVTQYLGQRSMPLFMMHASNDHIIPLALGQKAFAAAREPKEFLLLQGIDHNDFPDVEQRYREQLLSFMERVTAGAEPVSPAHQPIP